MEFVKDENQDIIDFNNRQKHLNIKEKERIAICERAEFGNVTRLYHANRLEDEFYQTNIQSTQAGTANAHLRKEQEERLSRVIVDLNKKEIRDTKYRQHFLQSSPYLRNVQNKLREAYNKKAISTQIAENESNRQKEKSEAHYAYLQSKKALYDCQHKEYLEAQESINRKAQYKKDLQNQMITKYQEKQRAYEEKLKEKKEIEDIVKRMNDEDVRELEIKRELQRKTQEEIDKYLEVQEIWKADRRKKLLEDNKKEEEHIKDMHRKQREQQDKVDEKKIRKEKWLQDFAAESLKAVQNKKERAAILDEYQMQLHDEQFEDAERKKLEKAFFTRIDEQNVLEKQCREKEERDKQYWIEEKRWAQVSEVVDDKYKNRVKTEADNRLKYFTELRIHHENTAKLRVQERVEEFNRITLNQKEMKENEDKKNHYIELERLRLLKTHAPHLRGFIAPGLL